jgi:hypothetical protein
MAEENITALKATIDSWARRYAQLELRYRNETADLKAQIVVLKERLEEEEEERDIAGGLW